MLMRLLANIYPLGSPSHACALSEFGEHMKVVMQTMEVCDGAKRTCKASFH